MFHETVKRSDGVPYAVCMLCNSAYKHPRCWKSGPTNSRNRHLDDCAAYQRLLKTGVESHVRIFHLASISEGCTAWWPRNSTRQASLLSNTSSMFSISGSV